MFDIFIILLASLLVIFPVAFMFVGFLKNKKKTKSETVNAGPAEPDDKVMLHGHDLSKWNYLGYTRCTYVDENGKITSEYPIFLFASKNDMKRRSCHITSEYAEKNHPYMNKCVKPWATGEGEIYQLISGDGNSPSDFLKQHMLDTFGAEWNTSTRWWGTNDKAKYNSAQNKQNRERKKKETVTEDNVVTVEFGKQA